MDPKTLNPLIVLGLAIILGGIAVVSALSTPSTSASVTPWFGWVDLDYEAGAFTTSADAAFSCTTVAAGPFYYQVDCVPASPAPAGQDYTCHAVGVSVTVGDPDEARNDTRNGTGNNETEEPPEPDPTATTVTGATRCGGSKAECTAASTSPAFCHDVDPVADRPPLRCSAQLNPPFLPDEWHVRCYPTDPPLIPIGPLADL